MTTLRQLLREVEIRGHRGPLDTTVRGICSDSRLVKEGDVFVCLPGYRTEGGELRADRHDFIPAALQRGAAALVIERETTAAANAAVVVQVEDAWATIAAMACELHGNPSRELLLVGVTGTSGKTSTTYFVESVLQAAGHVTARLGTIEYKLPSGVRAAPQTTPEAPALQALLRQAVTDGATAAVMEVSSHALELRRAAGIAYDVAVFTNLSQDHLNFHPDMHHYLRAKGRLFEELASGGKDAVAVVNANDASTDYIKAVNRGQLLTYGVECAAEVVATDVRLDSGGARFEVTAPFGRLSVALPHLAEYAVRNALAALAVGVALNIPAPAIGQGLAATVQIPGRFEAVGGDCDFHVVVDYAHKPGALEQVLRSAQALRPRSIITVFGCGGDRDRTKRPLMGEIATRGSHHVIVTSDNPRTEKPEAIIADILRGVPADAAAVVTVEPDRRAAIEAAIRMARSGDLVLIAGKGHETYQILGERRIDFDDREVARRALARLRRRRG